MFDEEWCVCIIKKDVQDEFPGVNMAVYIEKSEHDLDYYINVTVSRDKRSIDLSYFAVSDSCEPASQEWLCDQVKLVINKLYEKIDGECADLNNKKLRDRLLSLIVPSDFDEHCWIRFELPGME